MLCEATVTSVEAFMSQADIWISGYGLSYAERRFSIRLCCDFTVAQFNDVLWTVSRTGFVCNQQDGDSWL